MNILIVDDEPLAVESLKLNVGKAVKDSDGIRGVTNSLKALEEAKENKPDIVFLDIEMPGMGGVELATELKRKIPGVIIIFVTAYQEYAMKAWELQVDGYLLKPASVEDISRVLDEVMTKRRYVPAADTVLSVRCFGSFEVFFLGRPVNFKRKRAKEVLAYLICARGAEVSSGELCGILWEDAQDLTRKKAYLRQYIQSLREALDECGAGDIIIHNRNAYSVDVTGIDCDYYRYLKGERDQDITYRGLFMSQYSWAESINAELDDMYGV